MTRRRRRVVAPPTRLGPSEEGDLTALAPSRRAAGTEDADRAVTAPAPGAPVAQPAAVPPAAASPTVPDRAREDTDEAWGDTPDSDERILREKPPHW